MNKYIITTLAECGLTFNNPQSAQNFADRHHLTVCQVYYLDEHTPKFIGYGIEHKDKLLSTKDFTWV